MARPTLLVALACALALIGAYLILGGASYKPLEVADPCAPRPLTEPEGIDENLERLALSALDGAACELQVTREELALALVDESARLEFLEEHHVSDDELERAAREGLLRAVDDAERAGSISALEATVLREAAVRLPVGLVIDALRSSAGQTVLEIAANLLEGSPEGPLGEILDRIGG